MYYIELTNLEDEEFKKEADKEDFKNLAQECKVTAIVSRYQEKKKFENLKDLVNKLIHPKDDDEVKANKKTFLKDFDEFTYIRDIYTDQIFNEIIDQIYKDHILQN